MRIVLETALYVICGLVSLASYNIAYASSNNFTITKQADADINNLFKTQANSLSKDFNSRIHADSAYFLGREYQEGKLGEGVNGKVDKDPLYRTDKFDCVTFVETVLALAHANNLQQFKQNMLKLRYANGKPSYATRNHFTSVDWNPNNTLNGYVLDVTNKMLDTNNQPYAIIADTIINKPKWFLFQAKDTKLAEKKQALQQIAAKSQAVKSVMLYLPLNKLYDANGKTNKKLFAALPTPSVLEIVRPSWKLENKIGTRLHVSHMGLLLRTDKGLIYREASQTKGKVIDIPIEQYLKLYLNSSTVKGIAILKIANKN